MSDSMSRNPYPNPAAGPDLPTDGVPPADAEDTGYAEHTRQVQPPSVIDVPPPLSRPARSSASQPSRTPLPEHPRQAAVPSQQPARTARPPSSGRSRQRAAARAARVPASESGWYVPWWALVIMVGLVGVVALVMVVLVTQLGESGALGDQPYQVQVVTSTPALGQDFAVVPQQSGSTGNTILPTSAPSAAAPVFPTANPLPESPPPPMGIGVTVRVTTEALRIREEPGLQGEFKDKWGRTGDLFLVVEGPVIVSDLEWWKIQAMSDETLAGWAAKAVDGIVLIEVVK